MTAGYFRFITSRKRLLALWVACMLSVGAGATFAAVGTSVPISARLATGIAISETGQARVSGIPGYDAATRTILLADPKIDTLEFDRSNEATRGFGRQINAAWSQQVTNPLRAGIPPHPYLLPFRNNIQALAYDGNNLILTLAYQ